ncbi:hypothetical protein FLM9_1637 [Candidatus Synechococcus spongiarum]|uniref:Uncharacterized protein n=1 Tax=Candidatus Synechococcus spongiarum TaxID=431041 RepID=A0A171DI12_9SYNE|nr:hypothetical protein FLM9_1637 [Candidatus Synechococcus spongiarum]
MVQMYHYSFREAGLQGGDDFGVAGYRETDGRISRVRSHMLCISDGSNHRQA